MTNIKIKAHQLIAHQLNLKPLTYQLSPMMRSSRSYRKAGKKINLLIKYKLCNKRINLKAQMTNAIKNDQLHNNDKKHVRKDFKNSRN